MKNKVFIKYTLIFIIPFVLFNVNIIQSQAYTGDRTSSFSHESIEKKEYKIYFVIGLGEYWPYQ